QAFSWRQLDNGALQIDATAIRPDLLDLLCRIALQRHATDRHHLAKFAYQIAVNRLRVRLGCLSKGPAKYVGENLLGSDFIVRHVERQREDAMTMSFKDIPVNVYRRLLHLLNNGDENRCA